jgi:uncharacterized membrane protein
MKELKELQKDIRPKVINNIIENKHFLDSKQHVLFGKKHRLSLGQRTADSITKFGGSWTFIIFFFVVVIAWITANTYFLTKYGIQAFDKYPFILLNLALSLLAAIQAPVILMSQNRSSERDRARAEYDYSVNRRAEKEIRNIQKDLEMVKKALKIK